MIDLHHLVVGGEVVRDSVQHVTMPWGSNTWQLRVRAVEVFELDEAGQYTFRIGHPQDGAVLVIDVRRDLWTELGLHYTNVYVIC